MTIRTWREAPGEVRPVVLVIGGFLTAPPFYRPFTRRLLQRGAAAVVVANIWTWDWLLAAVAGMGPIVHRAARAAAEARRVAAASPAAMGAPILVVGHSAGGIVGRVLTATEPFGGRRFAAAPAIGALVTLGTPHHVGEGGILGRRVEDAAVRFANLAVPGAAFAPSVAYVAIASRAVAARADGTGRERVAARLYRGLLGRPADRRDPGDPTDAPREPTLGDGVVPAEAALLSGARGVLLDSIVHGQAAGKPWYGTEAALDVWWPAAIDAWRSALVHRASTGGSRPGRNDDANMRSGRQTPA